MSCQPKVAVRPLRADFKFQYERGTRLRVKTIVDGTVEGIVFGCASKFNRQVLELDPAELVIGHPPNQTREPMGFLRLLAEEIDSLEVLESAPKIIPKIDIEKLHHTVIVSIPNTFDKLITELKAYNVVGLNFYGAFVGRDGEVGWICLFFGGTLICIDVLELEHRIQDFWEILDKALFSNEKIEKVIYNSRPVADFLYHTKFIILKNVFDIQVSELNVRAMGHPQETLVANKHNIQFNRLSTILETFLKEKESIPSREITLLKEFEGEDFGLTSPMMARPFVKQRRLCKCVALDMKYLLLLQKELTRMLLRANYAGMCAQLEEAVNASTGVMNVQLTHPQLIPEKVFLNIFEPVGDLVDMCARNDLDQEAIQDSNVTR